jgi:fibronectin type 3 domain-containing protein
MKALLAVLALLLLAMLCSAQTNSTASVTLAWDPAPTSYVGTNSDGSGFTNYWAITNYSVYYGMASATYTNHVLAATNLTVSVSNLVRGATYYFAATATDTNGLESAYSQEVSCKTPPPRPLPPTVLKVVVEH